MVVRKAFPHGITRPKAMRAVMWHNLGWFNHYLRGDPLPDLSKPELPPKPAGEGAEKPRRGSQPAASVCSAGRTRTCGHKDQKLRRGQAGAGPR